MKINYYRDNQRTIGVGTETKQFNKGNPLNNLMWEAEFSDQLRTNEHKILEDNSRLYATATPHESDTFNEEIGQKIVRDKLIIKQCRRTERKLLVLEKYLQYLLNVLNHTRASNNLKLKNAQERLEQYK